MHNSDLKRIRNALIFAGVIICLSVVGCTYLMFGG